MHLLLFITLCTFIVWWFLSRRSLTREAFTTVDIQYVDEEYFVRTVMASPYFHEMNNIDLEVRSSPSMQSYQQKYVQGRDEFRMEERNILAMLIEEVDTLLTPFSHFRNMPWKLAKVSKQLEQGYPHTIGDIIILSDDFFDIPYSRQKSILIHEKVHVYQRLYPDTIASLYEQWGFQRVSMIPQDVLKRRRNNPDLQGWYQYKNKIVAQLYDKNAKMLSDSKPCMLEENVCTSPKDYMPSYIGQLEHPNEIMASMVPLIVQKQAKDDEWSTMLRRWMERYFV